MNYFVRYPKQRRPAAGDNPGRRQIRFERDFAPPRYVFKLHISNHFVVVF